MLQADFSQLRVLIVNMYSQVLDDQTFAALQSVMLMNNVEILFKLQQDPNFFPDLFKKLRTTPPMVRDAEACMPG